MRRIKTKLYNMKLEHYVLCSLGIVLLYTVAEFIAGFFMVSHDILTPCVYGTFGGEVVVCGLIKIFKLKDKNDVDTEING